MTIEKEKKAPKIHILPSLNNNKRVLAECSTTVVDIKKIQQVFNCSRNDAVVLAAAASLGMVPQEAKKA